MFAAQPSAPAKRRGPPFTIEALRPEDGAIIVKPAPPVTREMLSQDQVQVFNSIHEWLRDPNARQFLKVGGLAGTGKSTLVAVLARELMQRVSIAFAAFTGQAANVLGRKLRAQGIRAFCGTLHSLMYKPQVEAVTGKVIGWFKREDLEDIDLVVVDEASMVNSDLWNDLLSYGVPVIAVGDHGQLPPVGKDAVNLMLDPDLRLERIHRQAAGNPILGLAHHVRNGGTVRSFRATDDRVQLISSFPQVIDVIAKGGLDAAAICYFNKTRAKMNEMVRDHLGIKGRAPDPGDVVVCLKNSEKILFNGMRGIVRETGINDERDRIPSTIDFPADQLRIRGALLNYHQFYREKTFNDLTEVPGRPKGWWAVGLLFDYGYALTCHKSQGSQWREVVIRHETMFKDTDDAKRRWIYTAVTRAVERVYVIP
jgi:exodeoxyribonuclease-5